MEVNKQQYAVLTSLRLALLADNDDSLRHFRSLAIKCDSPESFINELLTKKSLYLGSAVIATDIPSASDLESSDRDVLNCSDLDYAHGHTTLQQFLPDTTDGFEGDTTPYHIDPNTFGLHGERMRADVIDGNDGYLGRMDGSVNKTDSKLPDTPSSSPCRSNLHGTPYDNSYTQQSPGYQDDKETPPGLMSAKYLQGYPHTNNHCSPPQCCVRDYNPAVGGWRLTASRRKWTVIFVSATLVYNVWLAITRTGNGLHLRGTSLEKH